jgi:hypothetical protein
MKSVVIVMDDDFFYKQAEEIYHLRKHSIHVYDGNVISTIPNKPISPNNPKLKEDEYGDLDDDCERDNCEGQYKYSINGGGTCSKCGHRIPCY